MALNIYTRINKDSYYFHDQILLPIKMYKELLIFESLLHDLTRIRIAYQSSKDPDLVREAKVIVNEARTQLTRVLDLNITGDKNPRWAGWYAVDKRRPNNGFPAHHMINDIAHAIESIW